MKKIFTLIFSVCFLIANSQNACTHTFNMYDSYGDGWNYASVNVTVNGSTVVFGATGANGSSSGPAACGTENFQASSGDAIDLSNWVSGSFDGEISWDIKDGNGTVIASGGTMGSGGGYGMLANCNGFCGGVPSWDCDANGTCSDPGTGQGQYSTQAACVSACVVAPSWDCDATNGTCSDPGTGQGQYSTQAACVSACVVTPSWDCDATNGTCSDPGTGQGQYSTQAACVSACIVTPSWDCDGLGTCFDPGNGSGQYLTQAACLSACIVTPSWDCDGSNGTCSDPGNGFGQYSTQAACLSNCIAQASWDCNANGTCSDPGNGSGQYYFQSDCINACVAPQSWDCDANGTCSDPGTGQGQYLTQSACLSLSACAPIVSMDIDVPVHFMIFTDRTDLETPSNQSSGVSVSIIPHASNPRNYLNPGKTVRFKAGVTNMLNTNLTSALITLSSTFNDPYVTIITNQVGLNNITASETEFTLTEFEILIDYSCPPGHIFYADFEVVNQITTTTYNSSAYPISIEPFINVQQSSPGVSPGTMIDDDANPDSDGDDDHIVDPNEIIEITPQLVESAFDIMNLTDFDGSGNTWGNNLPFPGTEDPLYGCLLNLNNHSYINIWDNVLGSTGANVVSCLPDASIANSNWYVQAIQNSDYLLPGYDFVFDFNHNITCKFDLFVEFEAAIAWHKDNSSSNPNGFEWNDRIRWLSKITINPNELPCPTPSWDCDGSNGTCTDPGTGQGQYLSQAACVNACIIAPTWVCHANGTCFDPGNGSGQFSTQAACVSACVVSPSWDCDVNGTCFDPGNGSGQFSTQASCLSACVVSPSWDCDISNLTCTDPGTGQGLYLTQSACENACVATNTFSYTINSTKVFPNPFKEKTLLELQDNTTQSVLLFDVMGKLLREYKDISNNKLIIERGSLSSGTYLLKIINENSIIMERIVIE